MQGNHSSPRALAATCLVLTLLTLLMCRGATAACSTVGDSAEIMLPEVAAIPSRTTGVAPLTVFFDATGTRAPGLTARPFHELAYLWDFGDPAGGATWSQGAHVYPGSAGAAKNAASGGVAAHVFETPGEYRVSLTVTNGSKSVSNRCLRISVLDPDVVFSGDRTVCASASGNFADCPGGATRVTGADFDAISSAHLGPGKRLLFRRGEHYGADARVTINSAGPGIVGAYGSGARPMVGNLGGMDMLLRISTPDRFAIDWRIMDLEFDGRSDPSVIGVGAQGHASDITFLRTHVHDVRAGFSFSLSTLDGINKKTLPIVGAPVWDRIAIVDSTIERMIGGAGGNGLFMNSKRMIVMGNFLADSRQGEHVARLAYVGKGVISHNLFRDPAAKKHALTIRAPAWEAPAGKGRNRNSTLPPHTYSEYVVVADNRFVGNDLADIIAAVQPQNHSKFEARERHHVWERNWFQAGGATRRLLSLQATDDFSIRHNLFDMTSGGGIIGVVVSGSGRDLIPASTRAHVDNNTFYGGAATGNFRAIRFLPGGSAMFARNNLGHAPLAKRNRAVMIDSTIGAELTSGNNSSDAQLTGTGPNFARANPRLPPDFRPEAPSYAIASGTEAPGAIFDFFGNRQPLPSGMGAIAGRQQREKSRGSAAQ